jgi:hypothetical protein
MKKILTIALLSSMAYNVKAQNTFPFPSSGSVGIGTTSPTANLTLGGSGNPNPNSGIEMDYSGLNLTFKGESIGQNFNLGSVKMVQPTGSYVDQADMVFSTSYGSLLEKMRISHNGNVGIGTTSPQRSFVISNSGAQGLEFLAAPSGGASANLISYNRTTSSYSDFKISASNIIFGYGTTETNEAMRIMATGNVGIGTSDTHGYKFAVNGDIHAKKVVIDLINWPDYVFKPTYNLKPLSEVKSYIDLNHHLPEMPSEKEVAEKGVDLGEMNKLLTKKVEELTLYMIEKDKQVQKEQETNQSQQTQIDELKKLVMQLVKQK